MATSNTVSKNNRLRVALLADAVTPAAGEAVNSNAGFGLLVIGDALLAPNTADAHCLATLTLLKPSFSIAGVLATLLGVPLTTVAVNAGTAALAELRDSANMTIIGNLTVGASGGFNMTLNNVEISVGEEVEIVSGVIGRVA